MHVFVGSTNPVKLEAVRRALAQGYEEAVVEGIAVSSSVSDQPISDEETLQGATNRAQAVLAAGRRAHAELVTPILGIGLEGGVFSDAAGEMWSTVWVVVVDENDQTYAANGGRVKVPSVVAQRIAAGQEMGPIMEQLTGVSDVRKKQGMFGIITQDYVDRTEEYSSIAKMAIGLWHGRNWDQELTSAQRAKA